MPRLTYEQVKEVRKLFYAGTTVKDLAAMFNVSTNCVYNITRMKTRTRGH